MYLSTGVALSMNEMPPLTWLEPGQSVPPPEHAWGPDSPAPGLLAAGTELNARRLLQAYRQGCFPWFSAGQPVLWWSPDPRMVLQPVHFRVRRSLRQSIRKWQKVEDFELAFDRDFEQVMRQCASQPRHGQQGSWIVADMIRAYTDLHALGHAHSAEVWWQGRLVAGLYFVSLGRALFGESMFTTVTDGSKMALTMLVSAALKHEVPLIDCQQNTRHLASLGAHEISRERFLDSLGRSQLLPDIDWPGQTLYWDEIERLLS